MRATTLVCVECEKHSDAQARGWEAHLFDVDDDGDQEILVYCPDCAVREFHGPTSVDPAVEESHVRAGLAEFRGMPAAVALALWLGARRRWDAG